MLQAVAPQAETGAAGRQLGSGQEQVDGEQKAQRAQGRAEGLREGHHPPLQGQRRAQPALWGFQLGRLGFSSTHCVKNKTKEMAGERGTVENACGSVIV